MDKYQVLINHHTCIDGDQTSRVLLWIDLLHCSRSVGADQLRETFDSHGNRLFDSVGGVFGCYRKSRIHLEWLFIGIDDIDELVKKEMKETRETKPQTDIQ